VRQESQKNHYPRRDPAANCGGVRCCQYLQVSDADWSRFFEVNVMSGVRLSRAYLSGMLKRNWGRIVFISSESSTRSADSAIRSGCPYLQPRLCTIGLASSAVIGNLGG